MLELKVGEPSWDWAHHRRWGEIDPTIEGAILRLRWLEQHGAPPEFFEGVDWDSLEFFTHYHSWVSEQ